MISVYAEFESDFCWQMLEEEYWPPRFCSVAASLAGIHQFGRVLILTMTKIHTEMGGSISKLVNHHLEAQLEPFRVQIYFGTFLLRPSAQVTDCIGHFYRGRNQILRYFIGHPSDSVDTQCPFTKPVKPKKKFSIHFTAWEKRIIFKTTDLFKFNTPFCEFGTKALFCFGGSSTLKMSFSNNFESLYLLLESKLFRSE